MVVIDPWFNSKVYVEFVGGFSCKYLIWIKFRVKNYQGKKKIFIFEKFGLKWGLRVHIDQFVSCLKDKFDS